MIHNSETQTETTDPYRCWINSVIVVSPSLRKRGRKVTAAIAASMFPLQAISSSGAPASNALPAGPTRYSAATLVAMMLPQITQRFNERPAMK